MKSWDVRFSDVDAVNQTVKFATSAYVTVPAEDLYNYNIGSSRQIKVEKVGAYTWYGKATGENADGSEFLMVMSAGMPNSAALAGNINLESQENPGMYTYASLLLEAVLRQ